MKETTAAIVVAAGSSSRMGRDKIFMRLGGRPVLSWTLAALQEFKAVEQIIVVLSKASLEKGRTLAAGYSKVKAVCAGGPRRQDSVNNGLKQLDDCRWVIIQDGARPFLTGQILAEGLKAVRETGSAVAAVPVNDTVKEAGSDLVVKKTLDRENLWSVQTPQIFRSDIIFKAHRQIKEDVTDDAAMVEKTGCKVKLFRASYDNIKITTVEDIALARIIARGMK